MVRSVAKVQRQKAQPPTAAEPQVETHKNQKEKEKHQQNNGGRFTRVFCGEETAGRKL